MLKNRSGYAAQREERGGERERTIRHAVVSTSWGL